MCMVIMFFIVLGLTGYYFIGTDLFPKTNIPFVTIYTTYPGAGAREIETQVVDPIEEAVASVSGLKHTTSTASEGMALTVLEFSMSTDADMVAIDVQKAVDAVMHRLPKDITKPVISKYNINSKPIMTVVLAGNRSIPSMYALAKDEIKERLEPLPGVGRVRVLGGQEREILVDVNRSSLESYGLSINQVLQRLAMENLNAPAGSLKQPGTDYTVRLVGEFSTIEDIRELRIPFPGGSVPLKNLATVKDGLADEQQRVRLNDREAVAIIIQKQSDASIVDTAATVEKELEKLKKTLPRDVEMIVATNNATFIHNSLGETKRSLVEGVLMCGIVLAFFLREWRSVLTVMLAIPTSIISTFLMMYLAGFSFNLLSLMGLTLCVGILVDDSIVVLENIHRHRSMGKDHVQAAIDGRNEIGLAAVAITLQDVVVFLPIAFMSGMVGQFFRQFGLTVVFATLFSLFISFTLTPMMSAHLGKRQGIRREFILSRLTKPLADKFSELTERGTERYATILIWALGRRKLVVGTVAGAVILSAALVPLGLIGSEFMTNPDQSRLTVSLELPSGSSLDKTDGVAHRLEKRIDQLPEVKYVYSQVGESKDMFAGSGSHLAEIEVVLYDKGERKQSVWQVAQQIRQWKEDFPGVKMTVTEEPVVGAGEQGAPVQLEITGPDVDHLSELASQVQKIVETTPGAVDVRSTWKPAGQPEVQVLLDRLRAASYGLSAGEIGQAMRASVAGEAAGKYREKGEEIDIRVRLDRIDLTSVNDVAEIKVGSATGQVIPLREIADIKLGTGPTTINHKDRQRLITISANLKDRPLGDVTGDISAGIAELRLPQGYKIEFYGAQKDMEDSFRDLIMVLVLSVVLVYMILVILYESFLTPFIRLLSLPCGLIGALWALFITGSTFNLMSLIGLVMLDGLAAKSGTLLIDYTNTLMKRGLTLREALLEAGRTRLRPIIMTACTMIAGVLPTALALAEGSELRRSMAIVLIGGMFTSALLTPILIPVAYSILNDLRERLKKWRNHTETSSENITL